MRNLSGLPISAPLAPCLQYARRLLRRDVGGAIHLPRAGGRRPGGERDGSRPGRPGSVVNGRPPAMVQRASPLTALAAQGPCWACSPKGLQGGCGSKIDPGHKTPSTRGPKGNPFRRAQAHLGPSHGCGVGLRVTRRTLAGAACGAGGAGEKGRFAQCPGAPNLATRWTVAST